MATTASRGTSCRCNSTSDRSPRYGGNGWNAARARRSSLGRNSCRSWRAIRFPGPRSWSATPLSAKLSHEEPNAVVLRVRNCGGEGGNILIYPAPEILRQTLSKGGANLVSGARNLIEEWERAVSGKRPVGSEKFVVGRDVAVTPG